jgi:hypothetical protein
MFQVLFGTQPGESGGGGWVDTLGAVGWFTALITIGVGIPLAAGPRHALPAALGAHPRAHASGRHRSDAPKGWFSVRSPIIPQNFRNHSAKVQGCVSLFAKFSVAGRWCHTQKQRKGVSHFKSPKSLKLAKSLEIPHLVPRAP